MIVSKEIVNKFLRFSYAINEKSFFESTGVHGVMHALRVLLLCVVICDLEGVSTHDEEMVFYAAIYHDVGRVDDSSDAKHGRLSWQKVRRMLEQVYNEKEMKIIKFLIVNHCIDDGLVYKNISFYKFSEKEQELVLMLFKIIKDADGLDRVRANALDIGYLRLDSSKHLVQFANRLLALENSILDPSILEGMQIE